MLNILTEPVKQQFEKNRPFHVTVYILLHRSNTLTLNLVLLQEVVCLVRDCVSVRENIY